MAIQEHISPVRRAAAAVVGNALEFYDFITYGFFSIQIGHAFFPSRSVYASLMLSLATFGVGFVTRPIGGVVIGALADRVGRRPAMMLSFTLMGGAIIAMALIPSYARIGVAAPVLAILARLVQGFSLGGEVGPTTAYVLESAPLRKRGLMVSWQFASQAVGTLAASLVAFALSNLMAPAALDSYGWRIAFLLGAAIVPYGLWLRRNLPETLPESLPKTLAASGGRDAVEGRRPVSGLVRIIVLAFVVLASATIGTYVVNYIATFAQATLHMTPAAAFAASAVGQAMTLVGAIFGGWLSDRVGRRPVMVLPSLAQLAVVIPIFSWITRTRSPMGLIVGMAIYALLGAIGSGVFHTAFSESLPARIRGSAFAITYALAIALFGGTTQLVITWLIHATGSIMAPAWYLLAASGFGVIARCLIIESAPVRIAALKLAVG
ncbi:MAG: MFS transporter [Caulobacteraceae bacterium]